MPDGSDLKLNPEALVVDHFIVTGLLNTRPVEPGGLVTAEGCVAGPIQRMSKDLTCDTLNGLEWGRLADLGVL